LADSPVVTIILNEKQKKVEWVALVCLKIAANVIGRKEKISNPLNF